MYGDCKSLFGCTGWQLQYAPMKNYIQSMIKLALPFNKDTFNTCLCMISLKT